MICFVADDIEILAKETLPFGIAPYEIIRISAAKSEGQKDSSTDDPASINYYFPGKDVAEPVNPRKPKVPEYHTGSWVSTLALALASLTLYCTGVVEKWSRPVTHLCHGF